MTAALAIVRSWMPPENGRQGRIVRQSTDAEIIIAWREDASWWVTRCSCIHADRVRVAIRWRRLLLMRQDPAALIRMGCEGPSGQVIELPWRGDAA